MANTSSADFVSNPYLSQDQQSLLMTALNSNKPQSKPSQPSQQLPFGLVDDSTTVWAADRSNLDFDSFDDKAIVKGRTSALPGMLPNDDINFSQFDDQSFDFGQHDDSAIFDDDDDVDDHSPDGETESHEKRKMSDDFDDSNDANVKRQEGTEKIPKKPGRKPLLVEPTNKRKAQNRAAQRAFRERKEKHMKDMETKVEELEKASEAANNENGLLKAKVERLQMELRDYKKRLSMSSTNNFVQAEPISNRLSAQLSGADGRMASGFSFDFPHFGDLPSNVFTNNNNGTSNIISASPASMAPISTGRSSSMAAAMSSARPNGRSASPQNQRQSSLSNSTNGRSPSVAQSSAGVAIESINNDGLAGLFGSVSPPPSSKQPPVNVRTDSSNSNPANPSRIFQFNSNAGSVASPSASSNSYGACSSATSPESNRDSPAVKNKDATLNNLHQQSSLFANTTSLSPEAISGAISPSAFDVSSTKGIDWMAAQNGGQFDPTLFGDYRESQNAIIGNGDFTGGFFDSALPVTDWSSPFNWGDAFGNMPPTGFTPAIQKNDPLATADLLSSGIEPATTTTSSQMRPNEIGCDKLWQKIANNKDFQDGKFDVDDLCSELKKKARCSEAGVAIGQADVDAALARMPQKNPFNSMR